jgi:predicted RNA-binding Zn-ribbon protein involved in translation (DUF1610 family)
MTTFVCPNCGSKEAIYIGRSDALGDMYQCPICNHGWNVDAPVESKEEVKDEN